MNFDQLISSVTLFVLGLIFALLPHATRPDLFFAVTVPREFPRSALGIRIVRRFQFAVFGVTIIAIALAFAPFGRPGPAYQFLLPLGQLTSVLVAFLLARRAVLPHAVAPERTRDAGLRNQPSVIPGGILAAAGPLLLIAASAVASLTWPERLPNRLPIHFGLSGPDRWIDTSPAGLAQFFLLVGSVQVLFLLITLGLSKSVGRAAVTGERGAAEIRFRRMTIGMLLFTSYFLAIQSCLVLVIADGAFAGTLMNIFGLTLVAAVLIWIVILIRMGQGGSREIGDGAPTRETGPLGDRRPDSTWKLGLFYYNPEDPALFIEKRFGIGYTVNFGNRWTWVVILVLVSILVAAVHFLG